MHEVIGWPGPMTHYQYCVWRMYLRLVDNPADNVAEPQTKEQAIEQAKINQEVRHGSLMTHPLSKTITVKRKDLKEGMAAELLHSGITRKDRSG